MTPIERFGAYAADFEKSLADDDWSRLEPHFHPDAVYQVESDRYGCEISGPAAIFAGMKKSVDGLDRRFDERGIALKDGPHVEGDELRMSWAVTYRKGALPPFVLRGRSLVRVRDGRIERLVDSFDDGVTGELDAWVRETGVALDPSYV